MEMMRPSMMNSDMPQEHPEALVPKQLSSPQCFVGFGIKISKHILHGERIHTRI